ncbi:hypothetical protein H5410_003830 [Solanum commersonii]|uniref:Uncharacterized protein n=1 Tax=Solanum commersonii TaxID=4109 RepID=A0A9J6B616_SOLCO|nr:hypothetical protein H5410_003830 [Solanum commersonii]
MQRSGESNRKIGMTTSKLDQSFLAVLSIYCVILHMNGAWFDDFEIYLEGAKRTLAGPDSDLTNYGSLSICFEHCILAHIVAITLIPKKGSLSSISTWDALVLYCLLQKYHINWAEIDELKTCILAVERGMETVHDVVEKLFSLQKDTGTEVGTLHIAMIGIK